MCILLHFKYNIHITFYTNWLIVSIDTQHYVMSIIFLISEQKLLAGRPSPQEISINQHLFNSRTNLTNL